MDADHQPYAKPTQLPASDPVMLIPVTVPTGLQVDGTVAEALSQLLDAAFAGASSTLADPRLTKPAMARFLLFGFQGDAGIRITLDDTGVVSAELEPRKHPPIT